jgi:hypothetical protein
MNAKELERWGIGTPEYTYLKECTERIAREVGEQLSDRECIALMWALHSATFECHDGFLINDDSDINKGIGRAYMATIAAALATSGKDDDWFREEFLDPSKENEISDYAEIEAMELRLTSSGRMRNKYPPMRRAGKKKNKRQ